MSDLAKALCDAAAINEFFAVETLADDSWLPFRELLDPESLRHRVDAARDFLAGRLHAGRADVDERATASMQLLGMVARLVSPCLATATGEAALVPALTTDNVRWRPTDGGRVEYAFTATESGRATPAAFERHVLDTVVEPLERAVRAEFRLSTHVTRGNVASALFGAATVLRPTRADGAAEFARAVLRLPYLAGMGRTLPDGTFRRSNCCLFYRIPYSGKCGDCVLLGERGS